MRTRFASVLLPVLLLAATGSAQSCSGDTGGASLHIRNTSDVALDIVPVDEPRASVRPNGSRALSLGREAGDCTDWQVKALTEEGVLVATTGPPVCDGDQWEITQEDVDAAVAGG
jgi:hypothetical protein